MKHLVPIDYIYNYVSPLVRSNINNDVQILEWALNAYRNFESPIRFKNDIVFLKVLGHKTEIPQYIHRITKAKWLNKSPSETQLSELYSCVECKEPATVTERFDAKCPFNHRLFITSSFYNDCWEPVNYIGEYCKNFICKVKFYEGCENYTTDTLNKTITTTFKEGILALEYEKEIQDIEGNYMLPKLPNILWEYLNKVVLCKYWEGQMQVGVQNAHGLYQLYRQESSTLESAVRGRLIAMSIKVENVYNLNTSFTNMVNSLYVKKMLENVQ